MYYRRKIVLSILKLKKGKISKIDLQKLLFIFNKYPDSSPIYDFVPYKYGCFSFQCNADLGTMTKYNLVAEENNNWILLDNKTDYISQLKPCDQKSLSILMKQHGYKSTEELISYTYQKFPYWATKSTIAKKYLTDIELAVVDAKKITGKDVTLFTIGYEGITLEAYLNKLIQNDVRLLLDVRKNAKSMKYGFSKYQLANACEGIGINYMHLPEVGIESNKRQQLNTQDDYNELFQEYCTTTLKNTKDEQNVIRNLITKYERIALTCFEENICQCHRKHLAEMIVNESDFKVDLCHI